MRRKSQTSGVRAARGGRIQFEFAYEGVRYRPSIRRAPTEENLREAHSELKRIRARIANGTFCFDEEFPEYRYLHRLKGSVGPRTCNELFDEFLKHCVARMQRKDLSFATVTGYRKLLAQVWRPQIGKVLFTRVRYSTLTKIVDQRCGWSKKTYNNAVSALRCAFEYGYRDFPERFNPASALTCLRITKKDRRAVLPFAIQEAEALIRALRKDWGEAIGNYDEFRFFTGLRPSEEIALRVDDYDPAFATLQVTKARVLRCDKDRTKTNEDRTVELCPRAVQVIERHLALRAELVAAGKVRHAQLFFHANGNRIGDPEDVRWRWAVSLQKLSQIRYRSPYHARHSFITWNLMIGRNLLWTAQQHGHSVEVMLRMYAAWIERVTAADMEAIREAMAVDYSLTRGNLTHPAEVRMHLEPKVGHKKPDWER